MDRRADRLVSGSPVRAEKNVFSLTAPGLTVPGSAPGTVHDPRFIGYNVRKRWDQSYRHYEASERYINIHAIAYMKFFIIDMFTYLLRIRNQELGAPVCRRTQGASTVTTCASLLLAFK